MKALKAVFASLVLVLNILFHITFLLPLSLVKLVLPFRPVRLVIDAVLNAIAESWIGVNKFWMNAVGRTRWQVQAADDLPRNAMGKVQKNLLRAQHHNLFTNA